MYDTTSLVSSFICIFSRTLIFVQFYGAGFHAGFFTRYIYFISMDLSYHMHIHSTLRVHVPVASVTTLSTESRRLSKRKIKKKRKKIGGERKEKKTRIRARFSKRETKEENHQGW